MILFKNPKYLFNHPRQYWYYNVNQEQSWNDSTFFPSISDSNQLELVKQQEQQMLYISKRDSTVLFRHHPDAGFLSYISDFGIQLPVIKVIPEGGRISHNLQSDSFVIPYINTAEVFEDMKGSPGGGLFGTSPELVKTINNKYLTRCMAQKHGFNVTEGHFCEDEKSLRKAYDHLCSQGFEKCVIKIPYGSSGKGLKIIDDDKSFERVLKFIVRRSPRFHLLIEGWHPVKQNINCQLYIDECGPTIIGVTEQQIDSNGVYAGTIFTPSYDHSTVSQYNSEMIRLGKILSRMGYKGICGVDSIISMDNRLYPVIELNARFTQVTYLLPLICEVFNEYKHAVSSCVRFESREEYDFMSIKGKLDEYIPDLPGYIKFIYTFASYSLPDQSKTIYRMCVLFCGKEFEIIRSQIAQLHDFKVLQ
ncbi:ATP-grasp domain-containing protein [Paenibacillus lautus]|uniref:ATP-grasp domain-containing protein n=1 Tax=Paenibacillus lautus TaxID=1401 RepID=UPI003D29BCAA